MNAYQRLFSRLTRSTRPVTLNPSLALDVVEKLEGLLDYFDQRQDCEFFSDGPLPNEEMRIHIELTALMERLNKAVI